MGCSQRWNFYLLVRVRYFCPSIFPPFKLFGCLFVFCLWRRRREDRMLRMGIFCLQLSNHGSAGWWRIINLYLYIYNFLIKVVTQRVCLPYFYRCFMRRKKVYLENEVEKSYSIVLLDQVRYYFLTYHNIIRQGIDKGDWKEGKRELMRGHIRQNRW